MNFSTLQQKDIVTKQPRHAGYVYTPYVPLILTPVIYDIEAFTPRKGILNRYSKK